MWTLAALRSSGKILFWSGLALGVFQYVYWFISGKWIDVDTKGVWHWFGAQLPASGSHETANVIAWILDQPLAAVLVILGLALLLIGHAADRRRGRGPSLPRH